MKIWGLYSSRVDMYQPYDLIELFATQELAETVKAELIGKPMDRMHGPYSCWKEDPDGDEMFNDLHVRPLEVRLP